MSSTLYWIETPDGESVHHDPLPEHLALRTAIRHKALCVVRQNMTSSLTYIVQGTNVYSLQFVPLEVLFKMGVFNEDV